MKKHQLNELLSELRQDIENISVQHHTGGYESQQEALKTLFKLRDYLDGINSKDKIPLIEEPTTEESLAVEQDGNSEQFKDKDIPKYYYNIRNNNYRAICPYESNYFIGSLLCKSSCKKFVNSNLHENWIQCKAWKHLPKEGFKAEN